MKSKIGIIGDTHGVIHERAPEFFRGVDRIIHAGDIGGAAVLDALDAIAPVSAVRGNYDTEPEIQHRIMPDPAALSVGGLQFFLTHRMMTIDWDTHKPLIAQMLIQRGFAPRVFVFGHTHFAVLEEIDGILFVNPGYAGPDQYEGPWTAAVLEIEDGKVEGRIIDLPGQS